MIIQALHQLSSRLPDRRILTWEFFFNRFDSLYLEAQIALEKYGDIAFPRGIFSYFFCETTMIRMFAALVCKQNH